MKLPYRAYPLLFSPSTTIGPNIKVTDDHLPSGKEIWHWMHLCLRLPVDISRRQVSTAALRVCACKNSNFSNVVHFGCISSGINDSPEPDQSNGSIMGLCICDLVLLWWCLRVPVSRYSVISLCLLCLCFWKNSLC